MIRTALPHISNHVDEPSSPGSNVVIHARTHNPYFYPKHKTPYLLATNPKGTGRYRLNDKPIEISSSYFYLLNANDELEIRFDSKRSLETLFILFEEQFVKQSLQALRTSDEKMLRDPELIADRDWQIPSVPFELTPEIYLLMTEMTGSKLEKDQMDRCFFSIIEKFEKLRLSTEGRIDRIPAVKNSTRKELYGRLFEARELLHSHVYDQLSLEQVAVAVGMNKFHLLSHFKKCYGITPFQYLRELKLQQARQMLQSKQYSVSQVCHKLGFESIGSFSNLFTNRYQMRPSALLR